MNTEDLKRVCSSIQDLGIETPLPVLSESLSTRYDLLEVYRSCLAQHLAQHSGCDLKKAYEAIHSTNEEADFIIAVPRLGLSGLDKKHPAEALLQNVSRSYSFSPPGDALFRYVLTHL
jgi:hypothetical protein